MEQEVLFSSGLELANLVVSSGILQLSWTQIQELDRDWNQNEQIRYRFYRHQQLNTVIIAFVASPSCTEQLLQEEELVPSSSLPLFDFLCTRSGSSFHIHKAAVDLFTSIYDQLSRLKNELGNSNGLIITGKSLGGSVASLFTLWLLGSINQPGAKRPLCVTFGAPLVGDEVLQEAVSQHMKWNSWFLHVVTNQDLVPRLFISPLHDPNAMEIDSQAVAYKPFGTFLLCSKFGCTCLDDPEAVSKVLVAVGSGITRNPNPNGPWHIVDYGAIIEYLMSIVIFKGISELGEFIGCSLHAGIVLQLEAIEARRRQQTSDIDELIEKMEKWEKNCALKRKTVFDPTKKLNDMKVYMAGLEWYKKVAETDNKGYYDAYKNGSSKKDINAIRYKRHLNNYWKKEVDEAERMPQKEDATLRTRWLYAGTNYRRMVEPFDIAEYYKDTSRTDYKTNGRSQHYKKLEQWLEKQGKPSGSSLASKKRKVSASLTEDSCFWANVEEALIHCKLLKNGEEVELRRNELMKFEEYVVKQIKNYAVSPEIFLGGSSFMKWWNEHKEILGSSCNPQFNDFMMNDPYQKYAQGSLVLS